MLDKSTKKKEDRMRKTVIMNAGMKQEDDIARLLNDSQSVGSRPLKKHRVAVSQKGNCLH